MNTVKGLAPTGEQSLTAPIASESAARMGVFRAPGRVNLIGEHTDYNDGFVMPAAIGFYTSVAVAPRPDNRLCVHSEQFADTVEFDLEHLEGPPRKHWSDYVRGVAAVLQDAGYKLQGANLHIRSKVPMGAGLSSSAAIEVSTALALAAAAGIEIPRRDLVLLCQRAENEYSGARCGIMDQFISCFGRADHALVLDCRSLAYRQVPVPANVRIVICNTMVKHALSGGEYNERRAACEEAVSTIQQFLPDVRALRDVKPEDLDDFASKLNATVYRRCRHVVLENERVLRAAEALENNDLERFGQLMYESHRSLKDDYQVSCEELDIMVELARSMDGVFGARMTGGGFGGCTVNVVLTDHVRDFQQRIIAGYRKATGHEPAVYICSAAEGAGPAPNL